MDRYTDKIDSYIVMSTEPNANCFTQGVIYTGFFAGGRRLLWDIKLKSV